MNDKLNQIKRIFEVIGYVDMQTPDVHNVYKGNITNMSLIEPPELPIPRLVIVCIRPGVIIGKGGKNFDYIKESIVSYLGELEIEIVEDKFWDCWN